MAETLAPGQSRLSAKPRDVPGQNGRGNQEARLVSAVPALKERTTIGAQWPRKRVCARPQTPCSGVEQGCGIRKSGVACVGLTESQVVEELALAIRLNDRLSLPVWRRPIP